MNASRVIILFAFLCSICIAATTTDLRLNGLEIRIDNETGSILQLAHPKVGEILSASPESAGILDVAYPVEGFGPMRLASRFSRARITPRGDGAVVDWDSLGPSRPGVPLPGTVSAQVVFRAAPDGRSVILTCRIENHSSAPVPQVLFPDLHGLRPLEGLDETRIRFARGTVQPFAGPVKPRDAAPFYIDRGWTSYPPASYYGVNALRWLDFGGYRGGMSVFQKKWGSADEPDVRTSRTESEPASLRLLWEHRAQIAPGGVWESGEFWLTPHPGGWAKGIEVYRDWVREVNPPRELPRHIRDGIGFLTIWMMQEMENDPSRAAFRFDDLPRVAEDAKAHGIYEIVPWGWCRYFRIPVPLRTELGSLDEFLTDLRCSRELGVNIAPFTSIQNIMLEGGPRYGARAGTGNWTYHPELIPNFRPFYNNALTGSWVDTGNPDWQRDVKTELNRWVDLGLTSFSWDQFSNRADRNRRTGMVDLIRDVRERARAKDPQSTFSAESTRAGSMEEDGAVLDYLWNWVDYVDAGPILNVLRVPRLNCNVEDSPAVVRKGFADGLFLNVMPRRPDQPNGTALIGDVPELSASVKQVASLRKQFLPYFTEGVFLGDSILAGSASGFVRGYQLGDKLLIIVLNDSDRTRQLSFRSDLSLWLRTTSAYNITTYDGSGKLSRRSAGSGAQHVFVTAALAPSQLAIFEVAVD